MSSMSVSSNCRAPVTGALAGMKHRLSHWLGKVSLGSEGHVHGPSPCGLPEAVSLWGSENIDGFVVEFLGSVASFEEERSYFAPTDRTQRILWLDCCDIGEISEPWNDMIWFQA